MSAFERDVHVRLKALAGRDAGRVDAEGLGYYADVQQARLQQVPGVRLERQGSCLSVFLTPTPTFEVGRTDLTAASKAVLRNVADILEEYGATMISVHGHTDDSGSASVNQQLSEARAVAVARFLRAEGIRTDRLVAVGHGPSQPIAPNDSPEGRERNRRIELHLDPARR